MLGKQDFGSELMLHGAFCVNFFLGPAVEG